MAKQGIISITESDFSEVVRPNTYHNKKASVMIKEIEELVNRFAFSFPDYETRKTICYLVSTYIEREIIDKTTDEMMMNNGEMSLFVKYNDKEYPLVQYIYNLEMVERKNKLLKIKKTLWQQKVGNYS